MERVVSFALALASFAVLAGWFRARLDWPGGAGVAPKWQHFREHADEYDVLLVGSSRSYRSFAPREMEAVWRQDGRRVRAFNLGVPGAVPYEADYLVGEVLDLEPRRLRLLAIELWRWDPDAMERNELTPRAIHWHTPRQTTAALVSCATYPGLPLATRAELALSHVHHCARWLVGLGRGPGWLRRDTADPDDLELAREHRGYRPLEAEAFAAIRERREQFLGDRERFESDLLERHAQERAGDPAAQVNTRALAARVRDARAAGVEVVFVVPPGPWAPPDELSLGVAPAPPVVDYSDRERHPDLYEVDGRFDHLHVTADVARRLSRRLARDLLPHLPR